MIGQCAYGAGWLNERGRSYVRFRSEAGQGPWRFRPSELDCQADRGASSSIGRTDCAVRSQRGPPRFHVQEAQADGNIWGDLPPNDEAARSCGGPVDLKLLTLPKHEALRPGRWRWSSIGWKLPRHCGNCRRARQGRLGSGLFRSNKRRRKHNRPHVICTRPNHPRKSAGLRHRFLSVSIRNCSRKRMAMSEKGRTQTRRWPPDGSATLHRLGL